MSIKVHLYLGLPRVTKSDGNIDFFEVQGETVGECLENMIKEIPDVKNAIFDDNGEYLEQIDIWVNQNAAYTAGPGRPVNDGDKIFLFAAKLAACGG
ncbi:MAG: MoaD/ThiS family protein [Deltaproteobacteria bacterium]|nr:MoaD/ThiS family protein [Deltaproteobacteria bacterium]